MNFIKNVLATILGLILFCFLSFFVLLIIGSAISMGSSSPNVSLKNNSVIKLDLSGITHDYGGSIYIKDLDYRETSKDGLIDVLFAIDHAKTDANIKGISIENNLSSLGFTQRKALREKLEEFKKTGKFVLSYADNYMQSEYYLNSVADTIYLNPLGTIDFKGLSTEILYMKDLQEKTGIQMEVVRHGKYKSAVEPYLQQEMSPENREQNLELLQSMWNSIVNDIAESRKISTEQLNHIATHLNARNAELALENKMIDKIAYIDEYKQAIRKSLGLKKEEDINEIEIEDYIQAILPTLKNKAKDQIAVIFAQGTILGGEGSVDVIGEKSINKALKEARDNANIKAVVIRVNSPGGSALVSEIIWREIEITKKVKPVIVSMGDVAASGGYYIASNADYIFAEPTTITGSIGVFGTLRNVRNLAKRVGVNAEQVQTHPHAVTYSVFEPLSDMTQQTLTESIEHIYDVFLQRVATGRKMSKEEVNEIAQGRIWTGVMAKENGLVDELGGLNDAINYAAKQVEISDYRVTLYPEYEMKFKDLLRKMLGFSVKQAQQNTIIEQIGKENYEILKQINYLQQSSGVQALLPYQMIIK